MKALRIRMELKNISGKGNHPAANETLAGSKPQIAAQNSPLRTGRATSKIQDALRQIALQFVILIFTRSARSFPYRETLRPRNISLRKIVLRDSKTRNAFTPRARVCVQERPPEVQTSQILQAWGKILKGEYPSLSIEITRECPLKCPGCYAYEDAHLGGGRTLRELNDRRGQALVDGVLEVVERLKPLHLSLVGGDPLVRYRELELLIPQLLARGIHVQIVTSAFRTLGPTWASLPHLHVVVSIDGLQPEHDARRAPATYERILRNITGQSVTVHCTITGQMMKRPGYLREFLEFWTPRPEIKKVWFSTFTPQVGDQMPEILTAEERAQAIAEMKQLRKRFPKLDMPEVVIEQFANPPHRPEDCVFALTTQTLSADLETKITPCQFGGRPDCSSCGCIASMGLASVAAHKLGGVLAVGTIFKASVKIGRYHEQRRRTIRPKHPLPILQVKTEECVPTEQGRE